MTQPDIDQALRRPARAWAADGIPEIAMGAFWIVWGAVSILPVVFPGSAAARYNAVILMVAMIPFLFLANRIVEEFKIRLTYPRTGYLAPRKPSLARRIGATLTGLTVAAALAWSIITGAIKGVEGSLPLACALLIGVFLFVAGARAGIARLQTVGCGAAAIGGLVTFWGLAWELALGLVFLGTGVLCALSGAAALAGFLKTHPVMEEKE